MRMKMLASQAKANFVQISLNSSAERTSIFFKCAETTPNLLCCLYFNKILHLECDEMLCFPKYCLDWFFWGFEHWCFCKINANISRFSTLRKPSDLLTICYCIIFSILTIHSISFRLITEYCSLPATLTSSYNIQLLDSCIC